MYYPYLSDEAVARIQVLATASGVEDTANPWAALSAAIEMGKLNLDAEPGYSGPGVDLWMIVEVPKEKFSDKIEYDARLDLLLAPEGKFAGFAKTRAEADGMTTSKLKEVEVRGTPEDGVRKEVVGDSVYLTYKAQIKGTSDLKKLLEFFLSEGMLKPQNN